ncbi:MAG: hypothetical protein EPO65_08040 [Dehalococcoidia bacterium]|nr:MAG: hypothetical protein EPO65_08040 [Dehalococcoidia bacterium]
MHTISLIIHVIAAAILFGPQLLMFYAVTPATWMVENEALKRDLVKVIAGRFAQLSVVAIVVLLVTGLYQYYAIIPAEIRDHPQDYRFGMLFAAKMGGFTLILVLIGLHVVLFARKIARLSDAVLAGDEEQRGALEAARTQSFMFSLILLLVTLATLALGVALGDNVYSFEPR